MQSISLAGIVLLLFLVVCFGLLMAAFLLGRRAGNRGGASTCGNCGYDVTGLTDLRCPECGSDLRQVGIIAGGTRRALSPYFIAGIWVVALTMVMVVPMVVTVGRSAQRTMTAIDYTTNGELGLANATPDLVRFDVVWTGTNPQAGPLTYTTLAIQPINDAEEALAMVTVALDSGAVSVDGAPVDGSFDAAVIADRLPTSLPDEERTTIASDLVAIVTAPGAPQPLSTRGRSFNSVRTNVSQTIRYQDVGLTPYLLTAGWGVAWLVMVIFFFMRARRQHRAWHGSAGAG